ncbi:hypothetical protein HYU15_03020 [Candidatus Woesearchaeota archaeon]|nr:hypothetical protein [Candidatus Woesearchaeota archaeon]
MKCSATISAAGDAGLICAAFLPEKKELKAERASYALRPGESGVVFEISADDAVAFRASVNTITKMLSVIEKVKKV